jgi:hypothetical protein
MKRLLTPESVDDSSVRHEDLGSLFACLRFINRRLAGAEALLDHLRQWSDRWVPGRRVTLLDVATGSADLPLAATRWARERGWDLHVTAIDRRPEVLDIAREHVGNDYGIDLVHADALTIVDRFGAGAFDYVHAGLFIHHLRDDTAITMLRAMDTVAREGIVWNDLIRSRRGVAAGYLLGVGRPRTVRHDIVSSLRAGFTRDEAELLASRAGLGYARYSGNFLAQRFTIAGIKSKVPPGLRGDRAAGTFEAPVLQVVGG